MYCYRNQNTTNNQRAAPFLLPFLTGALVATPFAFLAGTNKPQYPQYYYPQQPQYYYPPVYYRR